MSVFSPKRLLFAALAAVLLTANAFAANPSPRNYARLAFDAQGGELILFGGTSAFDNGTQRAYDSDETWAWTGVRWVQRYPAHTPSARSAHVMAYDSARGRIVLFGGREQLGLATGEVNDLGDTWAYANGDWTELNPATTPGPRQLSAMAYDSVRDRMVLYGGFTVGTDGITPTTKSDTWEFDGTTWTQVGDESVKLTRPTMAYDAARNQTILLGLDAESKTAMYRFDAVAKAWVKLTPETLPDCANDSVMVYQSHNNTLMSIGGNCGVALDKTWEWNGTTWTEIKTMSLGRIVAASLGHDALRGTTVLYGGSEVGSPTPRSLTLLYSNANWRFGINNARPSPRSLFTMTSDPATQTVWLFGGLNEYSSSYLEDMWGMRNGQWFMKAAKDVPGRCDAPLAVFDTNRSKVVFACWPSGDLEIDVYEFDGAAFKKIETTKDRPDARRFGTLVYDETLKKVILFGGYDGQDFRDDTWTWDGANWTEVKKDKPDNRSLHAMWYDPLQKKTLIYGGIGRDSIEDHVERFSDMWAFTGTGWTKLNVTTTPGRAAGTAVRHRSGHRQTAALRRHEVRAGRSRQGNIPPPVLRQRNLAVGRRREHVDEAVSGDLSRPATERPRRLRSGREAVDALRRLCRLLLLRKLAVDRVELGAAPRPVRWRTPPCEQPVSADGSDSLRNPRRLRERRASGGRDARRTRISATLSLPCLNHWLHTRRPLRRRCFAAASAMPSSSRTASMPWPSKSGPPLWRNGR